MDLERSTCGNRVSGNVAKLKMVILRGVLFTKRCSVWASSFCYKKMINDYIVRTILGFATTWEKLAV